MGNTCPGRNRRNSDIPSPLPDLRNPSNLNGNKEDRKAAPSQPVKSPLKPLPKTPTKQLARALYNFDAINDDDLSFRKGDLMEIADENNKEEEWWLVIHKKNGQKGYIPSNFVAIDDASPQAQDWWFEFDRKESDKMLLLPGNPQGTFLVREATDKTSHVLSIRYTDNANGEPCVKHYRIKRLDNGGFYISPKKTFETLLEIIDYHKKSVDGLCCTLSHACPRIPPVVQFRELEISRDALKLTSKLGSGCFGDVWRGTLRKVVDVAVKTMKPGKMTAEAFLEEAKIMHKLTHRKLVQILAVVSVDEPFYIITEYMANGSMLDYLRSDQGKRLGFKILVDMTSQITDGMAYLEKVNFIHRDLRAANILVGLNHVAKVADFGLARIIEDNEYVGSERTVFPIKWTAPEAFNEKKFSIKSDVWSFGVLMYEIITFGKVPYAGMTGQRVCEMVDRGHRLSKPTNGILEVPNSYYEMMLKCWHKDPEQRPTFESLHNFFDDYFISVEPTYKDVDEM